MQYLGVIAGMKEVDLLWYGFRIFAMKFVVISSPQRSSRLAERLGEVPDSTVAAILTLCDVTRVVIHRIALRLPILKNRVSWA